MGVETVLSPGATRTVTVKAAHAQKSTWEVEGKKHGLSAGGFLAFTAAVYLAMYRAYLEANDAHYDALHLTGIEGQKERKEEQARKRGDA